MEALCQYELCLELNPHIAVANGESTSHIQKMYPDVGFYFWPSLIAFPNGLRLRVAEALFAEIRKAKPQPHVLRLILFDPELAIIIIRPGGDATFLESLSGLARDQAALYMEPRRFPPALFWPKEIAAALKEGNNR